MAKLFAQSIGQCQQRLPFGANDVPGSNSRGATRGFAWKLRTTSLKVRRFVMREASYPLPLFSSRTPLLEVVGALFILLSIAVIASARRIFVAHGTHLNPYKPTQAIVTTGLYRFSRNPIYIAFVVFTLSFTFFANSLWFVIFAVVLFFLLHFGVVKREEVYLKAKFGDSYVDYCRQVKRWL